jgi:multiple sugar transport system substrate-binding protein
MKIDQGYVAVPWQLDMRVMWYNKDLLEKAGAKPPTTWDEFLEAGKALKKINVYGFGTGTGAGNNLGSQGLVGLMINNGGGMFNAEGKPDCVTDANVEAMEFVREMVSAGMVDPACLSYTGQNLNDQWKERKFGMGIATSGLPTETGAEGKNLDVTTPLTSRNGTKQALMFVNNLMMYTNTPSQEASEAFLKYYLGEIKQYWQANVINALPVLQSIVDLKEFQANATQVKIAEEWQPVSKTYSQKGDKLFADIASVDGGQALTQFAQTMLQGKTDARQALTTLQTGIQAVVK